MAYATKYQIDFLNNDENNFSIYLLLKDYTGSISQLTGGPDPFVLSYTSGDDQIINPIRASEAEINFYNDGATPLTEFYSEDDEAWRIDFYFNDPAGAKLLWNGFVIQDSCEEIFQDPPHIVSLKGTDNLALLKDIPFNEAWIQETLETITNTINYRQDAIDSSDGIITLGVNFVNSDSPPVDFEAGSSPYADLVGFDIGTNNDRWILKNGATEKTFHLTGTIEVMFTGFDEIYRWLVQKDTGLIIDLVPYQLITAGVHNVLPFDLLVTLQPGERLFSLGQSSGNFDNNKTYYQTAWKITTSTSRTTNIIDKISLFDYIKYSLIKTGISLPFTTYCNIYENTMGDRQDDPGNDMLRQTFLFSGMFLSDDGTWDDCYSILEKILFPLNATLMQAAGKWVIIRWPELRIVSGGLILGSLYDENFEIVSGITLQPNIIFALGTNNILINADHRSRILRAFKNVKFTFNYEQPKSLINGIDLKTTGALDHNDTVGDIKYDYYEIPSFWKHLDGDESLIVVVTDIPTNTETERYIYMPKFGDQYRFLRFNPIEVTTGDVFDFMCSFRHDAPTTQDDTFSIRFLLIRPDNNYYTMRGFIGKGSDYQPLAWAGPFPPPVPINELLTSVFIDGGTDDSEWAAYSLTRIQQTAGIQFTLPTIPEDSVLLIDIAGGNGPEPSYADVEMLVKEMELRFIFNLNKSISITGQRHTNSLVANIKNKLEEEISIDDSPRNYIAGALFTASLTTFGEDIGDIHFTKTKSWHRYDLIESLRLSQITTLEREEMQSVSRTILEGSFKSNDPTISILNVIQLEAFPASKFLFGVATFNFMEGIFNTTLWEVLKIGETLPEAHYLFEYIYKMS